MPPKPRVLVREEIAAAGVELLRAKFDVDVEPEGDLAAIIGRYEGIIIRSGTKLTADLIGQATNLKVIGRAGVGVDNVDVEAATRRGIVVANAPESNVVSAAEHTIGLLVALARNIPQAHAALKQGRWERAEWGGVELAEKTLGVLGFGRIGQQVARRAVGLQMRVLAYDPFVSADRFKELGVESDSLDGVLARADFLTLHLPSNDETRGVINAGAIAKMKDGVRIVNAARGELIDEAALLDALRSGKVAAAALDVFATEPYSGPLTDQPNVVVTPHLAASTDEAQDRAGVIVAEQVVAALNGAFQGRADRPVNYVNAPLIAAERGIEVREERSRTARDYTNLVRVELRSGKSRVRGAGTTIGSDNRLWLVNILGFEIELELAPLFVLCRYDDVPGVIGRVGTLLGQAGVNIANMAVSRNNPGGKALMGLSLDTQAAPEVVESLRHGMDDAFVTSV